LSAAVAEIILALDVESADAGRRLLDQLPGLRWVKVGSVLMTREGATFIRELRARGLQVFLDLKWHDIPNTVAGAVEAAAGLGVAMATVHTLGGPVMLRAAQAAARDRVGLVGVTVLTSHSAEEYQTTVGARGASSGGSPEASGALELEVGRLAGLAAAAGLRGVVCSPMEIGVVKSRLPAGAWVVVPGIRRTGDPAGDQFRTATPREAADRGATHLVVGRPILKAASPARALAELAAEAGSP
jgi:orotidine-5'-phosphate decarboxylase